MRKQVRDVHAALDGVLFDGMTLMTGGFGPCGLPENLIQGVLDSGVRDLTVISTDCAVPDNGVGQLITARRVRKLVAAYVGENPEFTRQLLGGEIEVELNPMGTLIERIRAGGAGIPAFYVKTGYGTKVAEGKETREIGGEFVVLERWLRADLALVKAWKGDEAGNLIFNKTARNFNPTVATAARVCVAEVEEIVPVGSLDGDAIHLSGIYVDRLVRGETYRKRIERRMTRPRRA